MSAPPAILAKVQKLLALAKSSNPNEAAASKDIADKLIAKYNITELELSNLDPKEYYGENEKLFVTFGIETWRQQLAVVVSKYFDCQIVQEELIPVSGEGLHQYHYYVYGDDDQVKDTQFVYHAFAKKVDNLVDTRCLGRGPVYISSYCEGVVESIKWNVEMYGIDVPEIKKPFKQQEQKSMSIPTNGIVKSGDNKENPTENKIDINKGQIIKDIMAYFKGVDDGKHLSLQDILELEVENEEARRIQGPAEEAPEHPAQQGSTETSEGREDSGS